MQDANEVVEVMSLIANCDFVVELYTRINGPKIIWIGSASHGLHRRYFTIKYADTERPIICLINRSESLKSIDKVELIMSNVHIGVHDLISGGFIGVVRDLGLYRFLAQWRKLELSDFKPMEPCAKASNRFSAYTFHSDSLEKANLLPVIGSGDSETLAHEAAKEWNDLQGNYLGVVVDENLGSVVAVYYRGNRIA